MISVFVQELFGVLYQKIGQTWHAGMFFFNIILFSKANFKDPEQGF